MRSKNATRRSGDAAIRRALVVLERRISEERGRVALATPAATKQFLQLKLAPLDREVFFCVYLDTQRRVIALEELFRGTVKAAWVSPREVARGALLRNATAVIVAHNHPGGSPVFSQADLDLTMELRKALDLIEVQLLDHILIAGDRVQSLHDSGATLRAMEAMAHADTSQRRQSAAARAGGAARRANAARGGLLNSNTGDTGDRP